MFDLNTLKFDEKGLIPAIVVDTNTKQVLTLAYMNQESLDISMREGCTCFWSRSRQELWRKGETSGNRQHIVSITADCDQDALVIEVQKDGPACHTGAESCFHNPVFDGPAPAGFTYEGLMQLLRAARPICPRALIRRIFSKRVWIRSSKKSARRQRRSSSPPRITTGPIQSTRSATLPIT